MAGNNARLALNLLAIVAGMLMLTAASVPLYRLFCQETGYGGTTQRAAHALPAGSALSREITVQFNADTAPSLPWEFAPGERSRTVHVGAQNLTYFTAKNLADKPLTGRAVYNIAPFKAGAYFVKVQCFCFSNQTLPPGKQVNMPVSFYIDPAVMDDPEMNDVKTITLSYTFFPVKK